jgi:hypothetical protein
MNAPRGYSKRFLLKLNCCYFNSRQSLLFILLLRPLKGPQHNSSRINSNKDACLLLQFNFNSIDGRWQRYSSLQRHE